METSAGCISESFWDSNTIMTFILLLLMFITMCLPAIVAYRNHDKKQMGVSILCGLFGMFLLVPWIVSVVQVVKKYEMPGKEKGIVKPVIFAGCSMVLLLLGGTVLVRNYTQWRSLSGVSLIFYGCGLLFVIFLHGKRYWGGLMVMAPLLVSCMKLEITEPMYRLYEVIAIAGVGLIFYNVVRSEFFADNTEKKAEPGRAKWAEQTILGIKEWGTKVQEQSKKIDREIVEKTDKKGAPKMKLERCPNGHFYDFEKYGTSCPYCNSEIQKSEQASEKRTEAEKFVVLEKTETPVELEKQTESEVLLEENKSAQLEQPVNTRTQDSRETAGFKGKEPVVGWLVCIDGVYKGESFVLKAGRNFIGRGEGMDICLKEENSIAEYKQATIIYEPRSRQFIAVPGEVHELCYMNNKVVLANIEMNAYDVLDMGNTSLMLVPCCGPQFSW